MQKSQKRAAELIEAFETLNRAKKVKMHIIFRVGTVKNFKIDLYFGYPRSKNKIKIHI